LAIYTPDYLRVINALTPGQEPVSLIEVKHPVFSAIRLALHHCNVEHLGNTYLPCSMSIVYPDDQDKSIPKCSIAFANTHNEFSRIFDQTNGLQNGTVRLFRILPSHPDIVQGGHLDMFVENVSMSIESVQITLTFDDLDTRPAVRILYNSEYSPSLFS
jgi:Domain of unknown function (DUF1833)